MNATKSSRPLGYAIPVYEVRLVQSRRPLRLAEECIADGPTSARVFHAFIGLTYREHLASTSSATRPTEVASSCAPDLIVAAIPPARRSPRGDRES